MKNDGTEDFAVGRRRVMTIAVATGVSLAASRAIAEITRSEASAPACVLTPDQAEGPYFVEEKLDRTDIRIDPANGSVRPGALLTLALRVTSVSGGRCAPVGGARVDVWHCDAAGIYSDVNDMRLGTRGTYFLRGYQLSDASGRVRFTTIYPGAYPGRAVHIHFKVRTRSNHRVTDFTSQLYFDDALTDRVHALKPYAVAGNRRMRNASDALYRDRGSSLTLDVAATPEGYAAAYDVGVGTV